MKINNHAVDKSAEALLAQADGVFELARAQHDQADDQHSMAAKQLDNAATQKTIATEQHQDADKLEVKAAKLDALGKRLVADAVEIKGETLVTPRSTDAPSAPATARNPDRKS
jgi:hypothetical protein